MSIYLVSGATSFLGLHLVAQLLNRGHTVYAIVRPESKGRSFLPDHPCCRVILADVAQTQTWQAALSHADYFLHMAWDGPGMEGRAKQTIQESNIKTSMACLRAATQLGVERFFFFGSQAEYGLQTAPVDEIAPCVPTSEYGKAKLCFGQLAQSMAQSLGVGFTHLRIFSVYGPGDHPWTLVNTCLDGFLADRAVDLSSCEQPWNFLYVRDFVQAIIALCDSPEKGHGVVNIAGDETRPLREYVEIIHHLCSGKGAPHFGAVSNRLERPYGILPVNQKLHQLVSWTQQTSFEDGIREMIAQKSKEGVR